MSDPAQAPCEPSDAIPSLSRDGSGDTNSPVVTAATATATATTATATAPRTTRRPPNRGAVAFYLTALFIALFSTFYYVFFDHIVGFIDNIIDPQPTVNGVRLPKFANAEGKPPEVSATDCADRHAKCTSMARRGQCSRSPGWMIVNCPRACEACHLLDPKVRCNRESLNISTTPAFAEGKMNEMFGRIAETFGDRYGVSIVSTSPWIVTFENFLTDAEVDALISTNTQWERSTDTGNMNAFGETGRVVSQSRTSSNSWCRGACESHPKVQSIMHKIQEVTTVPQENFEAIQVLRYELGQKYNTHHDASFKQARLACGPRVLTFFLYLSDVEEGGETAFPLVRIVQTCSLLPMYV